MDGVQITDEVAVAFGQRVAEAGSLAFAARTYEEGRGPYQSGQVLVWRRCRTMPPWMWVSTPTLMLSVWWEGLDGQGFQVIRERPGPDEIDELDPRDRALLRRMNDATEGMLGHGLRRTGDHEFADWIEGCEETWVEAWDR